AEGGMVHVWRRVVETQGHASLFACLRQLLDDVLAIGSVGDLVVREGRIEHTEAVVMFGGKHHVLLAGSAGQIDEGVGVELSWIESLRKLPVIRFRDAVGSWRHNGPGGFDACERIGSPVNEHSEFRIAIPSRPLLLGAEGPSKTWREGK